MSFTGHFDSGSSSQEIRSRTQSFLVLALRHGSAWIRSSLRSQVFKLKLSGEYTELCQQWKGVNSWPLREHKLHREPRHSPAPVIPLALCASTDCWSAFSVFLPLPTFRIKILPPPSAGAASACSVRLKSLPSGLLHVCHSCPSF